MNYQLYELLFLFAVYGVLGWFDSICMLALSNGRYPSRKICKGPCSTACGTGAILILLAPSLAGNSLFGVFGIGVAVGLTVEVLSVVVINLLSGEKRIALRWYHPIVFGVCAVVLVFHLNPLLTAVIGWLPPWINLLLLLMFWIWYISALIDGISDFLNYRKKKKTITFSPDSE